MSVKKEPVKVEEAVEDRDVGILVKVEIRVNADVADGILPAVVKFLSG